MKKRKILSIIAAIPLAITGCQTPNTVRFGQYKFETVAYNTLVGIVNELEAPMPIYDHLQRIASEIDTNRDYNVSLQELKEFENEVGKAIMMTHN